MLGLAPVQAPVECVRSDIVTSQTQRGPFPVPAQLLVGSGLEHETLVLAAGARPACDQSPGLLLFPHLARSGQKDTQLKIQPFFVLFC